MKLVEILAKKLDVWPTGAAIAVQDGDARKTVKFGGKHANPSIALMGLKDVWQARDWKYTYQSDFDHSVLASDWKTAIVTKKQWQAERDRQKGGEWKRHRGGRCPVSPDTQVEVKHYDGEIMIRYASHQDWSHDKPHSPGDIMQYRIISQPQAEDGLELVQGAQDAVISCIAHNDGAGKVTHGPIMMGDEVVGEASPDWNQQAKWDQIDGPLRWRDEVTELNAYIDKYTRERDALIERLASEGFALIPAAIQASANNNSGIPIDEWQIGDVIQVISTSDESSAPLGIFKITDIDFEEPKYELDNAYYPNYDQMKFVRRP